jgi:phenylalanyl-tRNA synthetase beta subunit
MLKLISNIYYIYKFFIIINNIIKSINTIVGAKISADECVTLLKKMGLES